VATTRLGGDATQAGTDTRGMPGLQQAPHESGPRARLLADRLVAVLQFGLVYLIAQAGMVCFLLLLTDPGSPWGLLGLAGALACAWLFARLGE
jgi:hypothetical protein